MIIEFIELTTFLYLNKVCLKQHKTDFRTKKNSEKILLSPGKSWTRTVPKNDHWSMFYTKNSCFLKVILQSKFQWTIYLGLNFSGYFSAFLLKTFYYALYSHGGIFFWKIYRIKMLVKPSYYLKIMSETDIMFLWEIVLANFGTVGITIDADECVYILLKCSWEEMKRHMSFHGRDEFLFHYHFELLFFKTMILFYFSYFYFSATPVSDFRSMKNC